MLDISYIGGIGPGEFVRHLLEAKSREKPALLKLRLGLTMPEAEVAFWLARGKQSLGSAAILRMDLRTVNKHLEQACTKPDIENRAAATAIAIRAMTGSQVALGGTRIRAENAALYDGLDTAVLFLRANQTTAIAAIEVTV